MTETPFMPKATAVWLVENTTLTFKQIADFCDLHELEVKGIADGDVARGIKAYNPILAGQLSRDEIDSCSNDPNKKLKLIKKINQVEVRERKKPKYTPLSKRQDRPDACLWLCKNAPELNDGQISKLVNNKIFVFNKESKENGDLYGSIKPKEISNLIKEKTKADVNPSQLILKEDLNKIGKYKVEINFHSEVKAIISVKIDKIQSK